MLSLSRKFELGMYDFFLKNKNIPVNLNVV